MAIRLKEKIKKYLNGIWGFEILILVVLVTILTITCIKEYNNVNKYNKARVFDALFNEEKFIKDTIYSETEEISKIIYSISNNLEYIDYQNINEKLENETFLEKLSNKYKYAILNKETGAIITNDYELEEFYSPNLGEIGIEEIEKYIQNRDFAYVKFNNVTTFNSYINNSSDYVEKDMIDNYEEFYYSYLGGYDILVKEKSMIAKLIILGSIISIILILKLSINFFINKKEVNLKIKVIQRLVYVLRYGFKYKYTRNKLIVAFIAGITVIVAYLYLVASIRNQNLLVTFLSRYPFKGTFFIVLIPLLCIIYTVKKTLDISIINDGLKKLNEGNLDYNIEDMGQKEVRELVDNINQIKNGYKIAVDEKVKNEKLKTELISNVSHDLKTPLTSIINYVNILKNSDITEEERKDYLNILEKKSLKLKSLVDDLFEASKLNSGKMVLNKSDVDIIALVHQGVGEYSTLYEEKNIEFKVLSEEEELVLSLDGKLMSRVFENIIINALKYSLDNTRVYINIINKKKYVEINFKNISNYEMNFNEDEIFERFVRADKSRNSSIEGSGIGLSIARSIVELHSGNIKIEVEGDMFKLYVKIPKK